MACFCHKIYKFPIGNIWKNVILMFFDLRYSLRKIIHLMMKKKIMMGFNKFQLVHNKR